MEGWLVPLGPGDEAQEAHNIASGNVWDVDVDYPSVISDDLPRTTYIEHNFPKKYQATMARILHEVQ